MCTEVFEHIINPLQALKEFARLLKPGGWLVLTSPFSSVTHFAPYHYDSGVNRFFYVKAMAENGFEILEITPNGNYFEFIAQEINRLNSVALSYTQTRLTGKEVLASKILLKALDGFSKQGQNSAELLNFGFQVFAQKSKNLV